MRVSAWQGILAAGVAFAVAATVAPPAASVLAAGGSHVQTQPGPAATALIGKPVPPDAVAEDYAGKAVKLASLAGRPTIITFWATWCGPCVKEMPTFQKLLDSYGGKLQVVAIAMMDPKPSAAAFIKKHPEYRFVFLHDPAADTGESKLAPAFGIVGLPTNLFLDAKGVVRDKWLGSASEAALIEHVRQLMQ
jgi:thiol-disulfide isomerase/thioredoxin